MKNNLLCKYCRDNTKVSTGIKTYYMNSITSGITRKLLALNLELSQKSTADSSEFKFSTWLSHQLMQLEILSCESDGHKGYLIFILEVPHPSLSCWCITFSISFNIKCHLPTFQKWRNLLNFFLYIFFLSLSPLF